MLEKRFPNAVYTIFLIDRVSFKKECHGVNKYFNE